MAGFAILARSKSAAIYPIELEWILMVVRLGSIRLASGASSNPHIRISFGTFFPNNFNALIVDIAKKSFAQKNKSGN